MNHDEVVRVDMACGARQVAEHSAQPMKRVFVLLGAAMLLTASSFGQADVIIKKRAQEIRDQNNVRQGVTPPSQPAQPSTAPATSASRTDVNIFV